MNPATSRVVCAFTIAGLLISGGCGGSSDGGTPPVTVASVLITAPVGAPHFATLGRTAQFAAVAKDAGGASLGTAITWNSTSTGVASVNASGLVTAVSNGTTTITAISGGVPSTGVTVTVTQVAATLTITPASVAFGAISSTRQLSAAVADSGGAPVAGAPAVTWSHAGGAAATVSAAGLVTAVAVGATDTAVASGSSLTAKAPISVTQVVASVTVSSTGIDTLKTTGSTKQYTAVAKDSNANVIAGATIGWTSTNLNIATVNSGTGLATAASQDGSANITATSGSVNGIKALVVRHFAQTFSLSPNTPQSIVTGGGTIVFTGTAQDSALTNLTITWTSRNTAVVTMSPASGTSGSTSTATAKGNGSTFVVLSGGTRSDSAQITASNQSTAPLTAAVNVGDDFFTSVHNGTSNAAVDTIAAGGTVQWTWHGALQHSVESTGSPTFTSSGIQSTGTYQFTFATPGTYTYDCAVHGTSMTGRVVVQ